jgi:choice-of-anchor A domain-containing protein
MRPSAPHISSTRNPSASRLLLAALPALALLSGCYDTTSPADLDPDKNGRSASGDNTDREGDGTEDATATPTAAPPSSTTPEVCDGVDNDGDGDIDEEDAGCFDAAWCATAAEADSSLSPSSSAHALWLPGIHGELTFGDDAEFIVNSDGTATLTGTVYPSGDTSKGFEVDIDFTHHSATAPAGSPKEELDHSAYASAGGSVDPSDWFYYECFSGSLTGVGDWSGAYVWVSDDGPAFQVGEGANGKNGNNGASGWLTYAVHSLPTTTSVGWTGSGSGDINIDLGGCETCVDIDLGSAGDFNVFVFGNYKQGVDVLGGVAAGGNVQMQYFSVGRDVGTGPMMVAGGSLDLDAGTVHGETYYETSASITESVDLRGGDAVQGGPIDFAVEQAALEDLALDLAGLVPTGDTEVTDWDGIYLTGSDTDANVFELDGRDLDKATWLTIDAPAGSTVVINVDECVLNIGNFYMDLQGVDETTILWNFWEACWLGMDALGVRGSVLAPFADVSFDNGNFDGTLIGASLTGRAEGHHFPFAGEGEVCDE